MNNTALAGIIVGAVVVAAAGALAANSGFNPLQKYATVVSVEPAFETNRTPRQVCGNQTTLEQAPVRDEKRIAGSAIGAVVGGVLGSQVGSGSGRDAATVAGAAAGGYAGSKTQKRMQEGNLQEKTEEQCVVVYDTESVQAGFDVTYELDGVQKVVRMDREPGQAHSRRGWRAGRDASLRALQTSTSARVARLRPRGRAHYSIARQFALMPPRRGTGLRSGMGRVLSRPAPADRRRACR